MSTPLSEIPTLTALYRASSLKPTSAAPLRSPSSTLNDRIGLIRGDITELELDAIVNAANTSLLGGGGVDGAIHRAAGPELLKECRKLKGCETGFAKITSGHDLPASRVIHTPGPVYRDPAASEKVLRSCYNECLKLVVTNGLKSVAFSAISTGIYGYPSDDAAKVACETTRDFLEGDGKDIERVVFVTFDQKDVTAYNKALPIYFPPPKTASK